MFPGHGGQGPYCFGWTGLRQGGESPSERALACHPPQRSGRNCCTARRRPGAVVDWHLRRRGMGSPHPQRCGGPPSAPTLAFSGPDSCFGRTVRTLTDAGPSCPGPPAGTGTRIGRRFRRLETDRHGPARRVRPLGPEEPLWDNSPKTGSRTSLGTRSCTRTSGPTMSS